MTSDGSENYSGIARWLERFGIVASAAWGFAEATLFFFVPDVAVGATGLIRPRRALAAAAAAVGGALIGGTILYLVTGAVGTEMRSVMDAVPSIRPSMLEEARLGLLEQGGFAMFLGPFQSIPYKLYVTEWTLMGGSLPSLIAWTLPARAVRILPFGLLMAGVGILLRRRLQARPGPWLALYLASWVAFYAVYWIIRIPAEFGPDSS